jgi:predicted transcriptional regulator
MLDTMPEQHDAARKAKVPVQARIDPDAVAALDKMAEAIRPRPTRSEMVAMAVEDFVERHAKKKPK